MYTLKKRAFSLVLLLCSCCWLSGQNDHPSLNGFVLDNLLIPFNQIKHGGPPRDGIPSIDRPVFTTAEHANFLKEEDHVLAVFYNGVAKAYPIKIMDRHEIVNDFFKAEPVAVTYCPLCGSGMAFLAKVKGKRHSFGVSGLLYNSDVLLYDRETESLWSQIMGQAVAGAASGEKLILIPTAHTSWADWKARYPNTLVLTPNTGHRRNYDQAAYEGYKNSQELMFPVAARDQRYGTKEWVIGIEVDGKYKAYPFKELKGKGNTITDLLNGRTLVIHYNPDVPSAEIREEDGKVLPAVTLYWFAWYAFHPDTEVYQRE